MKLSFLWCHIQVATFGGIVYPNHDSGHKSDYKKKNRSSSVLCMQKLNGKTFLNSQKFSLTTQPTDEEHFQSIIAATINNNTGNHGDYSKTEILYRLTAEIDSINKQCLKFCSTAKIGR